MATNEAEAEQPKAKPKSVLDDWVDPKAKTLDPEKKAALQRQFEMNKAAKGMLPLAKVRRVIDRAGIELREGEMQRLINLADIVCDDEDLLTFGQLKNLAMNQVDVNMLHKLFNYANTNTEFERVEFYLDADEIFDVFKKIGVRRSKAEIEQAIDALDDTGDRDGRIDWEEFLSISSTLLGASVTVDHDDPDGTDFNQLRDSTNRMKENMVNTKVVVKELEKAIEEKKKEIERRIKDTTLEDVRKVLKAEWDEKDKLEIGILTAKAGHYEELKSLLQENDKEKEDLKQRFLDTCTAREEQRNAIDARREEFRQKFSQHFGSFQMVLDLIEEIDNGAQVVQKGLREVATHSETLEGMWVELKKVEVAPKISNSQQAIDYLRNQAMVIDEIKTKMQMMQRERDKYEDMIEAEMVKNKEKRIECVKLNMKITNIESKQLGLESKYQEQAILSQTLAKEVEEKEKDTDSKKVKGLRNTLFQFTEEKNVVEGQVEEVKMKLRQAKQRYAEMAAKVGQLNIELGELKILLDACKTIEVEHAS